MKNYVCRYVLLLVAVTIRALKIRGVSSCASGPLCTGWQHLTPHTYASHVRTMYISASNVLQQLSQTESNNVSKYIYFLHILYILSPISRVSLYMY